MISERILVTPRSLTRAGHSALRRLESNGRTVIFCAAGEQPTEEDLLDLLPGCTGYLAGVERITARVLESPSASELKVISRYGVGADSVDLAAAERRGIKVCITPGANSSGVAELAVGLLFALARRIPACDAALKAGRWERDVGIELRGRTLGVIGCGRVGREVARIAVGIGMNVMGYDPVRDSELGIDGFRYASLEEVFAGSDAWTLHCPAAEDGVPLLTAEVLSGAREGVFIVNTARANLVDDAAMLAALDSGRVAGYAVDVYEKEPPGDNPLVKHARVIATAHIASLTKESADRMANAAVTNLLEALDELNSDKR